MQAFDKSVEGQSEALVEFDILRSCYHKSLEKAEELVCKSIALYGAILGDVVGSRFEFARGPLTKEFEFITDQCEWTDDSVMTVAVAEALINGGKDADVSLIRKECIKSMKKWGQKYPNAGYGARFIH